MSQTPPLPTISELPPTLTEGAISIVLQDGIPAFRASARVMSRIEELLARQDKLSTSEVKELDHYEEIDDYLSYLNRIVRNLQQT